MTKVSVIIPNYNYGRFLSAALESVLSQTWPIHEVIVVDDGSTDNSAEVIAGYGKRVQFIKQKNQGVGAARNAGVAAASSDLVAFLDADDYWLPQKLELQVKRYLAEPELGLVHCGVRYCAHDGVPLKDDVIGLEGWVAADLLRFQRPVVVAPGSTSLIPRRVFQAFGGFRTERELPSAEDWEFCYRLACQYKFGFVPQVLACYRQHGVSRHRNIAAMEQAMLQAFDSAFEAVPPELMRVKRACYARIHMVLAGSYFSAGQYDGFVRNAAKSLWFNPAEAAYLLQYPQRWLKRAFKQAEKVELEQGVRQA